MQRGVRKPPRFSWAKETNRMELRRTLGLPLLVFYGLGTILGAGIYVLIGEVVGLAGSGAPLAFLLAGAVAGLTALSYAELGGRYPLSAGEAMFVQQAFGQPWLSQLTGWLIVAVGIISSATVTNGVVGYAEQLWPLPEVPLKALLVVLLTGLAAWGIRESVSAAALFTVIEVGGLLLVITAALCVTPDTALQPLSWPQWPQFIRWEGVFAAAFLAFYAFLGFEDMLNVAEEVKDPVRTLPRGILLALLLSLSLYMAVALAVLWVAHPQLIAESRAPLALVVNAVFPGLALLIAAISALAVVNGALVQVIKSSRILYGMGSRGLAPQWLASVSARTRTPVLATVLVGTVVLVLAVSLPLLRLAWITSFITLLVFVLANTALVVVKHRDGPPAGLAVPLWVPVAGALSALGFLLAEVVLAWQR